MVSRPFGFASALVLLSALSAAAQESGPLAPPPAGAEVDPATAEQIEALPAAMRTILFRGRLPFLDPYDMVDDELKIEFVLYAQPLGGQPLWTETRTVAVRGSEIDLALGTESPLPLSAFTRTFRFVAMKIDGGDEIHPRWPIECVVLVTPEDAAPGTGYSKTEPAEPESQLGAAKTLQPVPGAQSRLETTTRPAVTWLEAATVAAREGHRLATIEEWYTAYVASDDAFTGMAGHYEWVHPFVYHAQGYVQSRQRYHGKVNGCRSEELSPTINRFRYRLAADAPAVEATDRPHGSGR